MLRQLGLNKDSVSFGLLYIRTSNFGDIGVDMQYPSRPEDKYEGYIKGMRPD